MTDLRQAATFALTTLHGWNNYDNWAWPQTAFAQAKQNTVEAISLLEAALAEPEPERPTDQEIEEWADACPEVPLMELNFLHGWQLCFTAQEFSETIRAAIARWGNHPGSPDRLAQPELEEPSFGDVIEWASGIEPWATWLAPGGCLENAHFEFDRLVTAAVARWGSSQGILDSSTPQPAAGEVAELVDLIRQNVALAWEPAACMLGNMTAGELTRAAELLERLSPPQPVPVSERLPGPGDCDAEGRCWIGYPEYTFPISDTGDYDQMDPEWRLEEPPILLVATTSRAIWLPAHALPLPGEGEA